MGAPRAQTRAKGPAWALWTPILANLLENSNKQSAPVTWKSQRELPGIRKTEGQPENEYIHLLVCPSVFRCALCAQHASKAGCPEAVGYGFVSRCVCSFYGDKRRFSASLLTQKRSVSLPRQISVFGSFSGGEKERSRRIPSPPKRFCSASESAYPFLLILR